VGDLVNIRDKEARITQERVRGVRNDSINDRTIQRKDPKMYSSNSLMDVSPVDFDARMAKHEGAIMSVATMDVVTMPPTTVIMDAIKIMTKNGFRRIPITNAGTNRLEGIVTSVDLIDFLGGGDKNLLVEGHYNGNLLAAINAEVREIMQEDVFFLKQDTSIAATLKMMLDNGLDGLPIVDNDGGVMAICTEKDFMRLIAGIKTDNSVAKYMSRDVKVADPDTPIREVARIMVDGGFRKVPVTKGGTVLGIVTATDIMRFLGNGAAFDKLVTGNIHEAFEEPVSLLLPKNFLRIKPDMDVGEAAAMMLENNVSSLPVMEDEVLIGIITVNDLLKAIYE
jgi:CBS domain-containing protein